MVDRQRFSEEVHRRLTDHPNISLVRRETTELPSPAVIATGPLTSERLSQAIARPFGRCRALVL